MKFIQECSGAWARKEGRGFVAGCQGENLVGHGSEMGDSDKHFVWICLHPLSDTWFHYPHNAHSGPVL